MSKSLTATQLTGVRRHALVCLIRVAALDGFEVGGERHLGVHEDAATAGEADHQVGPEDLTSVREAAG